MNLVLVGINHRTAPVEVRERMNIQESRLPGAVANLVQRPGIREGLILSTCNRVEVAASVEVDVEAEPLLRRFLLDYHRCDLAPWEPYFYWRRQEDVVRHLFRVASSLDSMILGEPQILGQVKRAIAAAREVGALSGVLNDAMNQADIIISSTGAPHFIVGKDQAERLLQARKNRPIFFVDIAVPRDIDPAVNELDNAFVYDIDDLEQVVDANKKQREREAVWAEEIVNQEVQRMARRLASRDVAPTIVALEERLSRIRQNELDRFRGRLSTLTPEQQEA